MARRRNGRELFEIFREMKSSRDAAAPQESVYIGRERAKTAGTPALHTLRLGDRHQVEVFLSLGWVYGIVFFVFLALVGAFILGRRTVGEPEPVRTVEAGEGFADETAAVTYGERREEPQAGEHAVAAEAAAAEEEGEGVQEAAAPAPVAAQGLYTLRVATYRNVAAQRKMADDFVAWLKEQGYDARTVIGRNSRNLYVTIGSFETTRSDEANDLLREIRSLEYKNKSLADAFYQNVNSL